MKLSEFTEKLLELNKAGNEATIKHKEEFPYYKSKKKRERTNYHIAGSDENCELCKIIIDSYEEIMKLQEDHIGIKGIPVDSLLSAIKVTEAVIKMKKEEEAI